MQAKAKFPYPIRAFSGREYVRYEWRPVPEGCEDEARRNELLEVREKPEPISEPSPPAGEEVDAAALPNATDAAIGLAEEHGIDLASVEGTGEDGRILVGDVRSLVEGDSQSREEE